MVRHCQNTSVKSAESLNAFLTYRNFMNIIDQEVIEKNSSNNMINFTTGPALVSIYIRPTDSVVINSSLNYVGTLGNISDKKR